MPFNYEKYGFTKYDIYGKTLRLAVIIYVSARTHTMLSDADHQVYCRNYLIAFTRCLMQNSLMDEHRDDADYGAWIPFDAYDSGNKILGFQVFYANYLSTIFGLSRPDKDDAGPETNSDSEELDADSRLRVIYNNFLSSVNKPQHASSVCFEEKNQDNNYGSIQMGSSV